MVSILGIAARNLLQARRRSALLGGAIGLVTLLFVLMMSMSAGIRDNLVHSATTVSAGHVVVGGFYKATPTSAVPVISDAARIRSIIEKHTPGLDYVVERHRGWSKAVSETGSTQVGLSGLVVEDEQRFFDTLQLAPERDYKDGGSEEIKGDPRALAEPGTVVIFAEQARRLEIGVGDSITLQTQTIGGRTNTADVRVVAVAKDLGMLSSWSVFVPKQLLLDLYTLDPDTTGAFWIYLDDIEQSGTVMRELRTVFEAEGFPLLEHQAAPFFFKFETVGSEDWTGQKLDLTIWEDEVSFVTWVITAFDSLTGILVMVLGVLVAVGIMNAMWTAVRERTAEIGTMRAIGMTRGSVLLLFLSEAVLLGAIATVAGALVGALLVAGVDAARVKISIEAMAIILLSDTVHLVIEPGDVLKAVAGLTLFTGFSAFWPALRASRLSPVQALSHTE